MRRGFCKKLESRVNKLLKREYGEIETYFILENITTDFDLSMATFICRAGKHIKVNGEEKIFNIHFEATASLENLSLTHLQYSILDFIIEKLDGIGTCNLI